MRSQRHFRHDSIRGFSLIEILVVVAILGAVLAMGTMASFSSISRSNIASERDVLASLLISVRARALANMNEKHQGIHITPTEFILFEVDNLSDDVTDDPSPRALDRTPEIRIESGGADEFHILFEQLSGNASAITIDLSQNGADPQTIDVNQFGGIEW